MACSKYILTNTGSTIVTFNYRRCDDGMWEYQVELEPNQIKNIWLVDNTYSSANVTIVVNNQGAFPPAGATPTPTPTPTNTPTVTTTPTNTPTNTTTPTNTPTVSTTATLTPTETSTPTPSITASQTQTPTPSITASQTQTPTPSITATQTQTPTSTPGLTPTPTPNNVWVVYTGLTYTEACAQYYPLTLLYGNVSSSNFDYNTQWSNVSTFPPTINMTGFIKSVGGLVAELDYSGNVVSSYSLCVTVTPTPTFTPTPTQTIGYYQYSLGTGSTANLACIDFSGSPNTIYGSVAGGPGPNTGEFLYFNTGLTVPVIDGYYSNGSAVFLVSGGLGEITSTDPSGC